MKARSILFLILLLILISTPQLPLNQAKTTTITQTPIGTGLNPGEQYYTFKDEYPILIDNFENYTIGDFPDEGGWILEEYGQGANLQVIVDRPAVNSKSLQLVGEPGKPAKISHNLDRFRSTIYIDFMLYIENPSELSIKIYIQELNMTINIYQNTIIITNKTINTLLTKGWNRIALIITQTGETIIISNNKHYTLKLKVEKIKTYNKITIETITKIYIDNIIIKTTPYIIKLWEKDLGSGIYSVSWSPDSSKLAVGGDFGKIIVFDNNGNVLWESDNLGGWVESISWSPDGSKIVAGIGWGEYPGPYRGKVVVLDNNGIILWESGDFGGWVYSFGGVSWDPDGGKIAVSGYFNKVIVYGLISSAFTFSNTVFNSIGNVPSGADFCWSIDYIFSICTPSTELYYTFYNTGWHFVNLSIRFAGTVVYWIAGWVYSELSTVTSSTSSTTTTDTTSPITGTTTEQPTITVTETTTRTITITSTTTATETRVYSTTITNTIINTTTETITSVSVSPTTIYSTITKTNTVTSTVISPTTSIITRTIPMTTTVTEFATTVKSTSTITSTSVITRTLSIPPVTETITSITTSTVSWVLMEPGRALGVAVAMIIVSLVSARLLIRR